MNVSEHEIFRLEKSLHFLLSGYARNYDSGDGHTEFFSQDALIPALQHLELFCKHSSMPMEIVKGVSSPELPVRPLSYKTSKSFQRHKKQQKQAEALLDSVETIAYQFWRINRWLLVLKKWQHRICFEYELDDLNITFRLRSPPSRIISEMRLFRLFNFRLEDIRGGEIIKCWSGHYIKTDGYRIDEILITIPEASVFSDDTRYLFLQYMFSQSLILLKQLPNVSPANKEPMPNVPPFNLDDVLSYIEEG